MKSRKSAQKKGYMCPRCSKPSINRSSCPFCGYDSLMSLEEYKRQLNLLEKAFHEWKRQ